MISKIAHQNSIVNYMMTEANGYSYDMRSENKNGVNNNNIDTAMDWYQNDEANAINHQHTDDNNTFKSTSIGNDESKSNVDLNTRRPMNAFLIFCKRHRGIVRDRYPNLENR